MTPRCAYPGMMRVQRVQIGVLGPLTLDVDGEPVDLDGRRERAILTVLTVNAGHAVSLERLADHLWGGEPPRTSRKALQSAISRIRRVVGSGPLVDDGLLATTQVGYRLNLRPEQTDLGRFETLSATGKAQLHKSLPERARRSLVQALDLWRAEDPAPMGDGLAAAAAIVRLQERRLEVLTDRIEADLAAGNSDGLLAELIDLCERWPERERLHEQLMLSLYRDGRQPEALAVAHRLRTRLVEQHGLDPGDRILELQRQILRHDPALDASAPAQVSTIRVPTSTRPPRHVKGGLVGRDADLVGLMPMLDGAPLVTLVGPGGVGKTSLASGLVERIESTLEFAWCSLGDILAPDNLVPALATALGVRQRKGVTMREALVQRLRASRTLLVIDNCEHVLDVAADLVAELIATCPDLHVLATSRERLGLDQERVWFVGGLGLPGPDADDPRQSPAVQLFAERAARVDRSFELDDETLPAVVAICHALDGIPLALELAAARVRSLPPTEIATRLDSRFELLVGRRGVADRQHSLRATVEWSHDLLADRERLMFRRIGTFPGPFSMDAAIQVSSFGDLDHGQAPAVLADLVDKSMVMIDDDRQPVRYRLLDTMRVFAREQRTVAGESEAADAAFLGYMRNELRRLDEQCTGPHEQAAVEHIDQTFDNIRHAVDLAREHSDVRPLAQLLIGLSAYLRFRVSWEAAVWFQEIADRLVHAPTTQPELRNRILGMAAWGLWMAGQLEEAEELVRRARESSAPDDPGLTEVLAAAGVVEMYHGDARCIATTAHALDLAERNDRPWLAAYALGAAALTHAYHGDIETANQLLDRQSQLASRLGNDTARAWWLYCSAEVSGERDSDHTVALAREATALARRSGATLIENTAQITAVSVASRHGAPIELAAEFIDVITRCWQQGAWTHLYVLVDNLIEMLTLLGANTDAITLLHANPEGAPAAYGEQRARLDRIATDLSQRVPAEHYARAAAAGGRLGRDGLARAALHALASLGSDAEAS